MKTTPRRPALQFFLAAFFIALILIGIAREDVLTVISNATIICFSCIGLK